VTQAARLGVGDLVCWTDMSNSHYAKLSNYLVIRAGVHATMSRCSSGERSIEHYDSKLDHWLKAGWVVNLMMSSTGTTTDTSQRLGSSFNTGLSRRPV